MLEVVITKILGRARWEWRVRDTPGRTIMGAYETSRTEAKYQGERALFLLLMTTVRVPALHPPERQSPRHRSPRL